MLSKKIIKYVPPVVQQRHIPSPVLHLPFQQPGFKNINRSIITDGQKLEQFLGQWYKKYELVKNRASGNVTGLWQLYIVSNIRDKFSELTYGLNGFPETHELVSLNSLNDPKYNRKWVDIRDYILLPEQVEKDWINDLVQDNIKKYRESEAVAQQR